MPSFGDLERGGRTLNLPGTISIEQLFPFPLLPYFLALKV